MDSKQVERQLLALGDTVANKTVAAAGRSVASKLRKAMANAAPYDATEKNIWHVKNHIVSVKSKSLSTDTKHTFKIGVEKVEEVAFKNTANNRRLKRTGKTYRRFGALFYWRFVEFGTKKWSGKSFIRSTANAMESQVGQWMREELKKQMEKTLRKKL